MTAFFLPKLNIRIFNHKISIYKIYFSPLFLLKKAPFKPFQYVSSSKNNHLNLIFLIYCIIFYYPSFQAKKVLIHCEPFQNTAFLTNLNYLYTGVHHERFKRTVPKNQTT